MKDNIFRGRIGRESGLKTIDTVGTSPCASSDKKVREGAHCSNFGRKQEAKAAEPAAMAGKGVTAKKTTAAKAATAKTTAKAAAKPAAKKTVAAKKTAGATAAKPAVRKATAAKKAAPKKSAKNDDYILVEEVVIVEEYR